MRRTAGRATAAAIIMLLLGACTTSHGVPRATVAATTAAAATTSAEPCRAVSLALRYGPQVSPVTGEHGVIYALVNRGKTACRLDGYPGITIDDATGTLMKFRYTHHSQYVTAAAPRPVTLWPGAAAYVLIAKYRCDKGFFSNAVTIRLTLPGSQHIVLTAQASTSGSGVSVLSYCEGGPDDPGQLVGVSPIVAAVQAAGPATGH